MIFHIGQYIKTEIKTERLLIIFLSVIFLTNCKGQITTVKDTTSNLKEGKLIFSVSGETASNWELEVLFNQANVVIKEKYARGAGRKYIYDKTTNEILGLYDDVAIFGSGKKQYVIYHTPEELIKLALSRSYGDTTITKTKEFKNILGYKCQKYIIKHGNQVTVEVWITDKIKPGIIYPWTPLVFDNIALEYEIKVLGKTDRRYIIKSISDEPIEPSEFEHVVPDDYYLVVPLSQFSIDTMWSKSFEKNTFQSFSYPYYGNGRASTIEYLKNKLKNYIKIAENKSISIDFYVNKDGRLSDVEVFINHSEKNKQSARIKKIIKSMPKWIPAKVKNKPVRSKVGIMI